MKTRKFMLSMFIAILFITVGCSKSANEEADATSSEEKSEKQEKKKKEGKKDSSSLGDFQIDFSGEVVEEGDKFIIEGKSNLIPNSRLVGEVIVDDGETVYSDTTELVNEDGSFYMELDHHQYGEAEIIVRFDFDSVQEDEVKRHYGEKGQNLEGPFIYKHEVFNGVLKKAEVKVPYVPGESNQLALTAPEWYDLPEDYGDPRVWIEVEEIKEDGEFFYIHGRSNILEGSEIKVEYKYNRDTTIVKPDGSFDFKFDYEYLEDKEIIITFDPANWQWNEIQEAYGSKGQKLVGNLVVQDKYNSEKQYIEKRIPWDNQSSDSNSNQDDSKEDEESVDESDEEDEE